MAARRPIVTIAGRLKELPTADTLIGVPVFLRIGLQNGTAVALPLSTSYTLTIGLQAGGTATIQATLS